MRNLAVRDNELEWYEGVMAVADKRKRIVQIYHEKVGQQTVKGKQKRVKIPPTLYFKEHVSAPREVNKMADGEMMWRGAYIAFRGEKKNGGWSEMTAISHFDILTDKKRSSTSLLDWKHVDPLNDNAEKVRVWVKTADRISFNEKSKRYEGYSLDAAPVKKASQEAIDKAYKQMHEGQEHAGGMTADSSMADIAEQLIQANPGEAWQEESIHLGKVEDYQSEEELEEDGSDADGKGNGDGDIVREDDNMSQDSDAEMDSKSVVCSFSKATTPVKKRKADLRDLPDQGASSPRCQNSRQD